MRARSTTAFGLLLVSGVASAQLVTKVPSSAPSTVFTAKPAPAVTTASPVNPSPTQGPKELEAAADTACENWSFEQGLTCWTVVPPAPNVSNAFSSQPTFGDNVIASRVVRSMQLAAGGIGGDYWKRIPYPTGGVKKSAAVPRKAQFESQYWIGTFERRRGPSEVHGGTQGDAPQGELRSKPMRVRQRFASFLVGGGKSANVGVALQVPAYLASRLAGPKAGIFRSNDGWVTAAVAKGNDSEVMRRHVWDLAEMLSISPAELKQGALIVRFSIFDRDGGPFGHVSADDFRFTEERPRTIAVSENGATVLRDDDMPVWGFADTHTHPEHQIAFGGKTIGGDPDGPMSQALSTDKCTSIHNGVLRVMGGRNHMHAAIGAVDEHTPEGYPTFIGWPTYRTKTHQVQHADWLRRAFDGGQRLIVVLGVTNMFWATRALGPGQAPGVPIDDETVALRQIQLFKDVVARNASWMEIATGPAEARRIIHSGKLAVVLGVELDNFGNFKDQSYVWQDGGNYPIPPSSRLVALPQDPVAARKAIRDKLDAYHALGLRQMTALHYISGVFGGTAVFRGQFGLVNRSFTGRPYVLRNATPQEGVWYNVAKDWSAFQGFLGTGDGGAQNYVTCSDNPRAPILTSSGVSSSFWCLRSSVNAEGLTPRGQILFEELMRRGMLVDFEHASAGSFASIKEIAGRWGYPLMSSHSDVRELSFAPKSGQPFSGNAERDLAEYGTTQIGNVTHEGMLGTAGFQAVRETGGTAGVLTVAYRKRGFPSDDRPLVPNDCDGSTKTFAQSYLYAVDRLGGSGVALSTDRGFTDFIGPRFGTHAAYRLRDESLDSLKVARRQSQKLAQSNGVRYDVPFTFFHPSRFEFGDTTLEEEDAWKAMAYWTVRKTSPLDPRYAALAADQKIPASSHFGHNGRIEALVRGLAATSVAQLRTCCGDTPWEEAAMFVIKKGQPPAVLGLEQEPFRSNVAAIQRVYAYAKPAYDLWQRMNGSNEPLRKRIDGVRDWDVNVDGVAHYGMLPDMLQDMTNVGVTAQQLQPLFYSAEDYILMWERALTASASAQRNVK